MKLLKQEKAQVPIEYLLLMAATLALGAILYFFVIGAQTEGTKGLETTTDQLTDEGGIFDTAIPGGN